ncbi:MAG: hypothetical protein ACMG51_00520 [Ginsengibacter sp.]
MRNAIIAACLVAFLGGGISAVSAQTTAQPGQDSMKTDNQMNAPAKKKKKHHMKKKHQMKKHDSMGAKKDPGMMEDDMKNDGMSK